MAAHRFWRLYLSRNGGDTNYFSICELVLASSAGGAQGAVGGIASASGSQSPTVTPDKAFDASTSTAWRSSAAPSPYIQYDMGAGSALDVAEIRITHNASFGPLSFPDSFVLLHSDDGVSWTPRRGWFGQSFVNRVEQAFDASPIPANLTTNRILERTVMRNLAANEGLPTFRTTMPFGPLGGGVRHHTAPRFRDSHAGANYIQGTTTALGEPLSRRVDLYDQKSGQLVRQTFSKADGAFLFDYIGPGPWTVVGVDVSAEQNSVIYAHIAPSPMT